MPLSLGCWLSATERSVSCPLSSVLSCYCCVSSLWRTLLSSWWMRESLALAFFLARLLRGCRSLVARKPPPVLCGSGTGPGLSRARSLRHSLLTTGSLVLGPAFRVRSPTLHLLPMGCHGWGFVYVSMLWNVVCIISWKYWITFLWNLSFLLR